MTNNSQSSNVTSPCPFYYQGVLILNVSGVAQTRHWEFVGSRNSQISLRFRQQWITYYSVCQFEKAATIHWEGIYSTLSLCQVQLEWPQLVGDHDNSILNYFQDSIRAMKRPSKLICLALFGAWHVDEHRITRLEFLRPSMSIMVLLLFLMCSFHTLFSHFPCRRHVGSYLSFITVKINMLTIRLWC